MMVSTELMDSIYLVVITGALTIAASVTTQLVINRQKRSDFLKEKEWNTLLRLSDIITDLWIHVFNGTRPLVKEGVDNNCIINCFEEMSNAQAYIMMTGKRNIIESYWLLYESMQYVTEHYQNKAYESVIKMQYDEIKNEALVLVKSIAQFFKL